MKRRKKKPADFAERFRTTCGWCGRRIPANTEVFGGGGKARADFDVTPYAGQILPVYLVGADKTVLVGISALDSDAKREGHDFVYMTCGEACAWSLKAAFEGDIKMRERLDSHE